MWVGPISSCLPGGGQFAVACRRRGAFCKGIVSTACRGGLPFAPAKGSNTGQRGTGLSPLQTSLTLSCAGYRFRFFSVEKSKSVLRTDTLQRQPRRICPHHLAVPEKIFALLACSIFSTAAGAPPRCIRHWRRSAPHPLPLPRGGGGAVCPNSCSFNPQAQQHDFLLLVCSYPHIKCACGTL